MTTKISEANIQTATLNNLAGGGPTIGSIIVTDNSYNNLDDTAVALEGGFVKLIGSKFAAGCQVLIGLTPATSVTFISETEVRAQLPSTAAGTYIVYLVNPDGGTAIRVNAVTFSGTPTWVSGSALVGVVDTAISIQLTATDATTFALAAGSTLPPGVTLSSGGLLSGTITGVTEETVYNFTINAVDAELQDSPRSFAFTVTAGDQYFNLTTLLLPGSVDTFVQDASSNNFAVTVAGDTRPNTFNPYLTGWSNYFDGSGDYLTVPSNAAFAFGTGDFTVECWAYFTSVANFPTLTDSRSSTSSTAGFNLGLSSAKVQLYTTSQLSIGATTLVANTWYHIAVTRSGTTLRIWLNGVQDVSVSNSTNWSDTTLLVGSTPGPGNYMTGYISNLRVVKGTAVYTENFTPSTQPLTAISGTSLLTCQSNRLRDNSTNNFTITKAGDVKVQSFSPFAEPATTLGSAYLDGSGDYMTVLSNAAFAFGTGDFTIEAWIYTTSGDGLIWATHEVGIGSGWYFNISAGSLQWGRYGNGSNGDIGGVAVASNQWQHVAVTKSSGSIRVFVNGVTNGAITDSANNYSSIPYNFSIGADQDGTEGVYTGYISNLRVIKGTALYTDTFTPPTEPLTAVAGTSLLTLQNNQPVNNSQFLDSSTNNLLITRAGNTTQGTFSPYSPAGWSNYISSAGTTYIRAGSNTALALGAGDFTLECWVYLTSLAPSYTTIFDWRTNGTSPAGVPVLTDYNNNGRLSFAVGLGASTGFTQVASSNTTMPIGSWFHLALVRGGTTVTMYFNGVSVGSGTSSANIGIETFSIGNPQSANYTPSMYVSNVRLVKGTAVYTADFTPSTQPLTAVAGTSLLTCQSPQFVDNSTNRLAITRAGDTRVTNFAPFRAVVQTPATYSAYFDGTGDYLNPGTQASFAFGTGDFTVESWIYATAASDSAIYEGRADGTTSDGFTITAFSSSVIRIFSGSALISSSGTTYLNQWTHIAVCRLSGTTTLYINGVSVGTSTSLGNNTTGSAVIGGGRYTGGTTVSNSFTGYISNFRVVKGTALYTADFTPPTEPLTAIANTSLLTCQSPTFVDNSTNNFAITAVGNSQPSMVNPFGSTSTNSTGYTVAEFGGSMYFDGTGDSISVPVNNAIAMGTGNFTIEFWMYQTTAGDNKVILDLFDGNSAGRLLLWIQTSVGQLLNKGSFAADRHATATGVITLNNWIHVALVRSSGVSRFYINGVQSGSNFTDSTNYTCTAGPVRIGSNQDGSSSPLTGYITDFRIVKGQALYTSNFVPPLAPVDPVPNTTLLLNGTSAAITDATTRNVLETVGDAKISTAVAKFGSSSMSFDGSGDYLIASASPVLDFGTGDFTIETWVNFSALTSNRVLLDRWATGNANAWQLYWRATGTSMTFLTGSSTVLVQDPNGSNISIGTWNHIAVTRSGTTVRLFVNGIVVATNTSSVSFTNTLPLGIGIQTSTLTNPFNGYMQDLRITKGHARYTANFTPPATAFQTR